LLVGTAGDQTLRITPPLTIEVGEIDRALSILEAVLA
jgi:4-aminobutyrate aminotransferase-like enzyme